MIAELAKEKGVPLLQAGSLVAERNFGESANSPGARIENGTPERNRSFVQLFLGKTGYHRRRDYVEKSESRKVMNPAVSNGA